MLKRMVSYTENQILPDVTFIPDVRPPDVLIPDVRSAPVTAVRVVHMPSDKGLVQQPSSALFRLLRVQV
ncbi:hypothetical protein NP493_6382g00000 [Ridgeia piscesae]|uniref:Uncharacterized protein n=1 Tax=Ridgeia piscesae TaxID=27915 RepID=A0AAD9MLY6_RIDPI|nr:hypothetical protein NP493_6382g00000 [Ridgeia piscesae]